MKFAMAVMAGLMLATAASPALAAEGRYQMMKISADGRETSSDQSWWVILDTKTGAYRICSNRGCKEWQK